MLASSAVTSAWRVQPVFSSTCCNCARTVLRATLPLAAMSSTELPMARPRAMRALGAVRSNRLRTSTARHISGTKEHSQMRSIGAVCMGLVRLLFLCLLGLPGVRPNTWSTLP